MINGPPVGTVITWKLTLVCPGKDNVVVEGHSNTEVVANVGAVQVADRKATFRPRADRKGYRITSYKYTNWTHRLKREAAHC